MLPERPRRKERPMAAVIGGDALPGFVLPLRGLFAEPAE
jgi:hypothetical protein